jgi:hypothetical protein
MSKFEFGGSDTKTISTYLSTYIGMYPCTHILVHDACHEKYESRILIIPQNTLPTYIPTYFRMHVYLSNYIVYKWFC